MESNPLLLVVFIAGFIAIVVYARSVSAKRTAKMMPVIAAQGFNPVGADEQKQLLDQVASIYVPGKEGGRALEVGAPGIGVTMTAQSDAKDVYFSGQVWVKSWDKGRLYLVSQVRLRERATDSSDKDLDRMAVIYVSDTLNLPHFRVIPMIFGGSAAVGNQLMKIGEVFQRGWKETAATPTPDFSSKYQLYYSANQNNESAVTAFFTPDTAKALLRFNKVQLYGEGKVLCIGARFRLFSSEPGEPDAILSNHLSQVPEIFNIIAAVPQPA